MPILDLFLFVASLYMLRRSLTYLIEKDKAWAIYAKRQQKLGVKPKNLIRDAEWDRNATWQGVIYLTAAVVGFTVVAVTFLSQ